MADVARGKQCEMQTDDRKMKSDMMAQPHRQVKIRIRLSLGGESSTS